MGGLPAMEDEEDFFKFSSDECRWNFLWLKLNSPNLCSDTGLSGEETDDASEGECYQNTEYSQYTEIKEQMYQVRIPFIQMV